MMSLCGVYIVGKKEHRPMKCEEEAMSEDDDSDMDPTWMPAETDSSDASTEPGLCLLQ